MLIIIIAITIVIVIFVVFYTFLFEERWIERPPGNIGSGSIRVPCRSCGGVAVPHERLDLFLHGELVFPRHRSCGGVLLGWCCQRTGA